MGLVLERAEGVTLRDRLRAGPIPAAEAMALAEGVLAGAATLHAAGLVHGDLRPARVLLVGAAPPQPPRLPALGRGPAAGGARAAIHGLGRVLHELLTGTPPGASPRPLPPWCPPHLRALVADCLRPDPADRPPDAGALLRRWRGLDVRLLPGAPLAETARPALTQAPLIPPPSNLPRALDAFVGRSPERAALGGCWRPARW